MGLMVLFVLMSIVCVSDIKSRHISNFVTIPAIIGALIVFKEYLPALAMFVVMVAIYQRNIWAGGDVKLVTMIAAFLGWKAFIIVGLTFLLIKAWRKFRDYYPIAVAPFIYVASIVVLTMDYSIRAFALR